MAFSAALRRLVTSSAAPLAIRALGSRAAHHAAAASLFRPLLLGSTFSRCQLGPSAPLSSVSFDSSLVQVIESEIECAKESLDDDQVPGKYPFDIKDEPGTGCIILTREFHGENIEVFVRMPTIVSDGSSDDDDDQQHEKAAQSSLPLTVTVSKRNGLSLKFYCTAFADEISIDCLIVEEEENDSQDDLAYEGPDFSDLDENLQKAFHKYLEIRGISPATTNFLHACMINKENREYILWMKNLKNFLEK